MSNWLEDLMPPNPMMHQAWVDCLRWAIGDKDILAQFRAQTGCTYARPKSPFEAMIDKATGFDEDFAKQFVAWFNANIWGELNGRACNGDEPELDDMEQELLKQAMEEMKTATPRPLEEIREGIRRRHEGERNG